MHAEIMERPALRAAVVRHVGPYYRIGAAFARLEALAAEAGIIDPGAVLIAVYHDDPETTPEAELRSDAGIVVPSTTILPAGLTEVVIPAGRYVSARHLGPYEGLGESWGWLKREWLPQSGHRRGAGISYEVYPNHPGNAAPEALITDIYIPLT